MAFPITARGVPLWDGCTWPALALLAFWNCVEGVDATRCSRQLNVDEDLLRRWYRTARAIMAEDAMRRQEKIVFGRRGSETTDIEADESAFFSWSDIDPETKERVHSWYVWLGVVERGIGVEGEPISRPHVGSLQGIRHQAPRSGRHARSPSAPGEGPPMGEPSFRAAGGACVLSG